MSKVEGDVRLIKISCNYVFFKASRVSPTILVKVSRSRNVVQVEYGDEKQT